MLSGLSDKQIISLLKTRSLGCKQACREILRRPDNFIPMLIDILDKTILDFDSFEEESNQHIPAAMILAQLKEPRAYPHLVRLINFGDALVDEIWGDILTEQYVKMLRDTFNGDSSLLQHLIENRSASAFSRAMAILAWGMHYFDGRISREETVRYFRRLIREVYTGKPNRDDETVLSYIAHCAREHQLEELMEDVQTVYSGDGIDPDLCGSSEEYAAEFNDPKHRAEDEHIDDAIKELNKWQWFKADLSPDEDDDYDDDFPPDIEPGRNDPCPCGSGKKYKHCCLPNSR
jgi:hypothetical protein